MFRIDPSQLFSGFFTGGAFVGLLQWISSFCKTRVDAAAKLNSRVEQAEQWRIAQTDAERQREFDRLNEVCERLLSEIDRLELKMESMHEQCENEKRELSRKIAELETRCAHLESLPVARDVLTKG